jgi:ArsR family transcriptional regulator
MKSKLTVERVHHAAKVLKCIAHPDRLRLVECLETNELSVKELVVKLKLSQAVVSKHLAVLRRGGIVQSKIHGNFRHYSVCYANILNVLDCMRKHGGEFR